MLELAEGIQNPLVHRFAWAETLLSIVIDGHVKGWADRGRGIWKASHEPCTGWFPPPRNLNPPAAAGTKPVALSWVTCGTGHQP